MPAHPLIVLSTCFKAAYSWSMYALCFNTSGSSQLSRIYSAVWIVHCFCLRFRELPLPIEVLRSSCRFRVVSGPCKPSLFCTWNQTQVWNNSGGKRNPLLACGPGETHGVLYFSTSHNCESCSLSKRNDVFISSFVICWLFVPFNPPLTYFSINKTLEITILKLDTTLPKSWEIHYSI